jgi:hypothetical protein
MLDKPTIPAATPENVRALAEVQGAIAMARQQPRNVIEAREKVISLFQTPELAAAALYLFARGGSEVSGLTIRAAEALKAAWGNMASGTRELSRTRDQSVVRCEAWDLETNTPQVREFIVPLVRKAKDRIYALEDPRDIEFAVLSAGARGEREMIFKAIPLDLREAIEAQAVATLKAKVPVTPEVVTQLLEAFAEFGVSKKQIELRIQRNIEAVAPAQVVGLRTIYKSLRDGLGATGDYFEVEPAPEPPKGKTKTEDLAARLAAEANPEVEHPEPSQETGQGEEIPPEPTPQDPEPETPATEPENAKLDLTGQRELTTRLKAQGYTRAAGLRYASAVIGRKVDSFAELTVDDAATLNSALDEDAQYNSGS